MLNEQPSLLRECCLLLSHGRRGTAFFKVPDHDVVEHRRGDLRPTPERRTIGVIRWSPTANVSMRYVNGVVCGM